MLGHQIAAEAMKLLLENRVTRCTEYYNCNLWLENIANTDPVKYLTALFKSKTLICVNLSGLLLLSKMVITVQTPRTRFEHISNGFQYPVVMDEIIKTFPNAGYIFTYEWNCSWLKPVSDRSRTLNRRLGGEFKEVSLEILEYLIKDVGSIMGFE